MTRTRQVSLLLGAALLSLTGCMNTEVGFGLPVLDPTDAASAMAGGNAELSRFEGSLVVDTNGCFTWGAASGTAVEEDRAWIIWPDDARQDDDVGDGDALDAVGAVVLLADLPHGTDPESYFGGFGPFCGAEARGVLVVNEVAAG